MEATLYKLVALAFAVAFFASSSHAAPRAQSAEECAIAADMALVAQSLAGEHIQRPKALAIMARIYGVQGKDLMIAIVNAAYMRTAAAGASGRQTFAEDLLATCLKSAGNMDALLGTSL